MTSYVRIAEQQMSISQAVAALHTYEPTTVQFYDLGGYSPVNSVTLEDLGRMVVIAAQLTFRDADVLLTESPNAPWIDGGHTLIEAEPGTELYRAASDLYCFFDDLSGIGAAKASKLLHIKHPHLFPILDSELQKVYGALAKRRAQQELGMKRTAQRRWWAVIRDDLIKNVSPLREVRVEFERRKDDHSRRLCLLSDLRLLDILAWRLGRGDFALKRPEPEGG